MSQEQILKLINNFGVMTATEIINESRKSDESGECIRRRLKQMRKYKEIGFVELNFYNVEEIKKTFPILEKKIDDLFNNGYKIRRPLFVYYSLSLFKK